VVRRRSHATVTADPPPVSFVLNGQVANALGNHERVADVTLAASGLTQIRTNENGVFTLRAETAASYALALTKPGFVERATKVSIPVQVELSIIPADFDLAAFEEFAPRTSGLRKWMTDPAVLILRNVVDFLGAQANFRDFRVTDREIVPGAIDCIWSYLRSSISELTGGTRAFSRLELLAATSQSRFRTDQLSAHSIVVLFARDLGANGRGVAYGGEQPWTFNRGVVFLHADHLPLCSSTAQQVVPHELGHALGYAPNHVTKQPSIMGSPIAFSLTQFDGDAIALINQRPPGNRAPDVDPDDFSLNLSTEPQGPSGDTIPQP
jgi:hypothetical protein